MIGIWKYVVLYVKSKRRPLTNSSTPITFLSIWKLLSTALTGGVYLRPCLNMASLQYLYGYAEWRSAQLWAPLKLGRRCFRHGDSLSCIFFNIILEKVIRAANLNRSDSLKVQYYWGTQTISTSYVLTTESSAQPFPTQKKKVLRKNVGLVVNDGKVKYLKHSRELFSASSLEPSTWAMERTVYPLWWHGYG